MYQILESIKKSLEIISTLAEYLVHPSYIFIDIWNSMVNISYMLCLFIALLSLLSYISGYKKFAKLVPFSVILYTLMQTIGRVVR